MCILVQVGWTCILSQAAEGIKTEQAAFSPPQQVPLVEPIKYGKDAPKLQAA